MNIRVAVPEDLEKIYAIEQSTFSIPWSKESLAKELTNPIATYLVVEERESLIGYAGMWLVMGEGQITNIAIEESYRGKGVGSQLAEVLIEQAKAKGLQMLILEVRKGNEQAQRLYKKIGFKEIATRKDYYSKPKEDALIFQLEF